MSTKKLLVALLSTVVCGCASSSAPEQDDGLRRVTLALNWFPEVEHGGFYAAQERGFFEEEGLRVEIQPGGPGAPVIQKTAAGRVDFAVANADQVLLGREQQAGVVAVMAAMQDSPRCVMVHEKSGFRSLLDLREITLSVGSGKPFAQYLLSKLKNADVTVVPYQGSVGVFVERDDYAQQAYVFSEPFIARQEGGDPQCLMVSDLGYNPYTSLLITSESVIVDNPDLVFRMVRACVRGWQAYLQDPEPANRLIHQQNPEMTLDILAYGAEAIRPLCLPDDMPADQLGQMKGERWETLARQLTEVDLLEDASAWEAAYDNRYVQMSR